MKTARRPTGMAKTATATAHATAKVLPSEDRMLKSEALQFPPNSPLHEIAKAPRVKVTTLSDKEILSKTLPQQRLICILEQIAQKKDVRGQRGLASVLGISQPTIRDYVNAVIQDPLTMAPASFNAIAKGRGISEILLRAFISGDSEASDGSITPVKWLQAIESLDSNTIIEGMRLITERTRGLLVERDNQIEKLNKELSEVQAMKLSFHGTESGNGTDEKKPFKPHPGNQRLIDALNERQSLLGFEDEEWDEFCSNILSDWIDVWDWLNYSPVPIPNEYLTGGLPKILKKSADDLFKLLDGD